MGSSHSLSIPNYHVHIPIGDGTSFKLSYRAFVDHIILLRKVLAHPEMTEPGENLNSFIDDYCRRFFNREITTKSQQRRLPWEIDWIWHVHRLHPVAYRKDCGKLQSNTKLIDKKYLRLRIKRRYDCFTFRKTKSRGSKFTPSFDLISAIVRQRHFLEKFRKHNICLWNLSHVNRNSFEKLVQNYIDFLKLARNDDIIVPTFEIDLIWHTHMRFPSFYQRTSLNLCGFVLDHDDSIETGTLKDAYQKTADRWMTAYKGSYEMKVFMNKSQEPQYIRSCATLSAPLLIPTYASRGSGGGGGGGGDSGGCGGSGGGGGGGASAGCGGADTGGSVCAGGDEDGVD